MLRADFEACRRQLTTAEAAANAARTDNSWELKRKLDTVIETLRGGGFARSSAAPDTPSSQMRALQTELSTALSSISQLQREVTSMRMATASEGGGDAAASIAALSHEQLLHAAGDKYALLQQEVRELTAKLQIASADVAEQKLVRDFNGFQATKGFATSQMPEPCSLF